MSKTYIIAGGDLRFCALAKQLSDNNRVYAVGFDADTFASSAVMHCSAVSDIPECADYLVLPLPVSNDGIYLNTPFDCHKIPLYELTSAVKKDGIVFGGRFTPDVSKVFTDAGIETVDYLKREELSVLNARATAEGAVKIAIEEQPVTIAGEKILILGMGRIAKSLINILGGFGAEITVAARKYSDLAWGEIYGCKPLHISELSQSNCLPQFDLIFNTIPATVLDHELLSRCRKDCLLIDLASKPGGIDFDAAGELGLRVIWALSLPGKTAPVSSGQIIAAAIENILNERGRA